MRLFLVLGTLTTIGGATTSVYLPGLPKLARDFDVSASSAQLTLTTYLVGLALGQLLAGPLSDVRGRRRPLIAGMAIFSVVSLVCAFAPNVYALAVLRFAQGMAVATGMVIGRAVIRDLYSGAAAARYLSQLMVMVGLAPIVAPLVGGQILRLTSWRGIFVALAVFGLALTVIAARLLPETLPADRRRAAGFGETTRTFGFLLGDRGFVGFVLIIGFGSGAVFAYVAGSPFVLENVYGVSPQLYSILYGLTALLFAVGAQINAQLLKRRSPRRLLGFGVALTVVDAAALLAVVVLPGGAGLAAVMVPLSLVWFGWSFIQTNAVALALTDHPAVAGTASGLLGVSMFVFGAAASPLVGLGGGDTALPMAIIVAVCALMGALSLKLVPTTRQQPVVADPSRA